MSTINNSSTYGNLLHQAPADLRKLFRKLESLERKLIILNWSTTFNGICIKENLLPTYVKYIYNSRLRQLAPGGGQAGFRRMAREMDENLIRL